MRKHIGNGIKIIIFLSILVISLYLINELIMPKYTLSNNNWPTTSTYFQFYDMDKDSIDVLFLGSSVVVNSYSPQEIYNTYGIRSYNLASEQQSIFLSYYWLKEALRFQSPKAVVLDTLFLYPIHQDSPINTMEGFTRKCLDPMKWSRVKREAVSELCKLDSSQSQMSYYLKNLRYHTRWTELLEQDFVHSEYSYTSLKGLGPIFDYALQDSYEPYKIGSTPESTAEPDATMLQYLDKTVALCKENNISLILVSQTGNTMNDDINYYLNKYATDNEIEYINLCEASHYNAINPIFPKENICDHSNIWGAIKLSNYIGKILKERYRINSSVDSQYESTKEYYTHILKNGNLVHIENIDEYLKAVIDPNYTVFITTQNEAAYGITESTLSQLASLGLKNSLKQKYGYAYAAVISQENGVTESISESDTVTLTGTLRNQASIYTVTGTDYFHSSSTITIDGIKYNTQSRGINIVVYDNTLRKVIDSVAFDTHDDSHASR